MIFHILISLFLSLSEVYAFDITKSPFSDFKLNKDIIGVHDTTSTIITPPSIIISSWSILFKNGDNDATKISKDCPDDSTVCGVIKYQNGKSPDEQILQLLSLTESGVKYSSNNDTSILATWDSVKYGDYTLNVSVQFLCENSEGDNVVVEWVDGTSVINSDVILQVKHKQFCATEDDNNNNRGDEGKNLNESGLGFFGSTIIIMAVIFAGYIIAQAWFNTSTMGSSGEFINELIDIVVESISSIPRLLMEVVNKITGDSSSSRGGYSAV